MAIIFENVSFTYAAHTPFEHQALKNINLKINDGKITAIIGSTGSGKSTLIQHMNGLLKPTQGTVLINDRKITHRTRKIRKVKQLRKEVGLVFQFAEYQLFNDSVRKDVAFAPITMGVKKEEAYKLAEKYVDIVGLPASTLDQSPFNLSGGQKRRVAIAGILAMEGHTLVLDEPTAGLDPAGEADFLALFAKLNHDFNKTIVLVTHNMDHVLALADWVVVMHQSKIYAEGDPFTIFNNQKILTTTNLEPPAIFKLIYALQAKNMLPKTQIKVRTKEELVALINNHYRQSQSKD